ncbi:hypothetical protein N3K63_10990 [Microbacterium sp. W1N]|uniref:hypothetical protein n=1 Tax=Microbacterium festucae TaxID=2977531 RepID=UPI0021BFD55F|nr:hypothetical protein [Microbacterium festucae]MCT9820809.1 hypothetical protein [Microbacterium festucae]
MGTLAEQTTSVLDAAPRTARISWRPLVVTAALVVLLFGASGFLFGTVQGDIPWPATQAEETVYRTASGLEWGGFAVAFMGATAVAIWPPRRAGGARWLWALVALVGSAILGGVVFVSAFGFAQANYLFAFTS